MSLLAEKLDANSAFSIFKLNMRKIGVEVNETSFYFLVSLCDRPQGSNLGLVLAETCVNVTSLFINEQNKTHFKNIFCKSSAYSI